VPSEEPDVMAMPRPSPGTGKWWAIGVIGCSLAVAFIVWFGITTTANQMSATTISYHVVDERSVTVDFDVHRRPGTALVCEVRALAQNFGVVGSVRVPIPASTQTTTSHSVTVKTASLAVTGVVESCEATP
jgi:uncharacterized membrane protein